MTPGPFEAIAWSVGALAAFGMIMVGLNLLATHGVVRLRIWVEDRSPIVYAAVITAVLVILIASNRIDVGAALAVTRPVPFLIAVAVAPLVALIMYLVELLLSSRAVVRPGGLITTPSAQQATLRLTARPTVWWTLAVTSAVVEELIFRGMLLNALTSAFGVLAAVGVSALVFGLHHVTFGPVSIASKTVGGLLLAGQTLVAGTVLPAVAAHLIFQYLVWRRLRRTGRLA